MLAEEIPGAVFIAGGGELFQTQMPEVTRKIVKEMADLGVITVAIEVFAVKMLIYDL